MMFELWDAESANVIDEYETLESALADVREMARQYGRESVLTWSLLSVSEDGDSVRLAKGADLADLAGVRRAHGPSRSLEGRCEYMMASRIGDSPLQGVRPLSEQEMRRRLYDSRLVA